jgi:hypothetical protein
MVCAIGRRDRSHQKKENHMGASFVYVPPMLPRRPGVPMENDHQSRFDRHAGQRGVNHCLPIRHAINVPSCGDRIAEGDVGIAQGSVNNRFKEKWRLPISERPERR